MSVISKHEAMDLKVDSVLNRLPSDCWRNILDLLPVRDLISVSRTSAELNASAEPLLYRSISWEWDNVPIRRILQLLRAAWQRPERLLYVRHVSWLSSDQMGEWTVSELNADWSQEKADYTDVIQRAQAIVDKAEFPDASKWHQALADGDAYAFATILLSQMHNLQSLRLDYTFVWRSGYPGLMLKHALFSAPEGLLSKFNDLETVDYGTNVPEGEYISHFSQIDKTDGYPSCHPNQFMAWFRLPSVKSLGLWTQSLQEVVPAPQPLHLDRLHILVLTRSTIKEEEIPGLLSQTPNLRTLHLGLAYLWGKSCPLRNGAAVLQGLHSVSRTIEVLSFYFEYYPASRGEYYFDEDDAKLREPFRHFPLQFPRLRSVEVSITMLLGTDPVTAVDIRTVLPSTVQQLCLQWDFLGVTGHNFWDDEGRLLSVVFVNCCPTGRYFCHT